MIQNYFVSCLIVDFSWLDKVLVTVQPLWRCVRLDCCADCGNTSWQMLMLWDDENFHHKWPDKTWDTVMLCCCNMFDCCFDCGNTKQATPAVGRKSWTRQELWSQHCFWLIFGIVGSPAAVQLQALCCCGVWSRARWRGGAGGRPRPGAGGEARSAFGLWRLQTGGQRGHNLSRRRRRKRGRRGKREEEQLVMTSIWGL